MPQTPAGVEMSEETRIIEQCPMFLLAKALEHRR
jgi:hypothetical protein